MHQDVGSHKFEALTGRYVTRRALKHSIHLATTDFQTGVKYSILQFIIRMREFKPSTSLRGTANVVFPTAVDLITTLGGWRSLMHIAA
jgi:hypothetical protein